MEENQKLTKKELKAQKRAEKMDTYKSESKQSKIKWVIIGLASLIFAGFFGSMIFLAKQSNPVISDKPAEISAETGWIKGSEDAQVTLVEYGDFQCPACRAYYPVVKETLSGYEEGQVNLLYKHFPLTTIHPNAMASARAAEAAGEQGKFFEYHDMLFDMQDTWGGLTAADADAKFVEYAEALELDIDAFNTVRNASETEAKIRAMMDEGIEAGAVGTPSFFINGKKINNPQNAEDLKKLLDEELK